MNRSGSVPLGFGAAWSLSFFARPLCTPLVTLYPLPLPIMADAAWTPADVAKALCDALVASGKLRANPGFIREDREVKIAGVFECADSPADWLPRLFCWSYQQAGTLFHFTRLPPPIVADAVSTVGGFQQAE